MNEHLPPTCWRQPKGLASALRSGNPVRGCLRMLSRSSAYKCNASCVRSIIHLVIAKAKMKVVFGVACLILFISVSSSSNKVS